MPCSSLRLKNPSLAAMKTITGSSNSLQKESVLLIWRKCFVRCHLEYANSVWHPKRKTDVDKLERVQKRATKLIPELSKKTIYTTVKNLEAQTISRGYD